MQLPWESMLPWNRHPQHELTPQARGTALIFVDSDCPASGAQIVFTEFLKPDERAQVRIADHEPEMAKLYGVTYFPTTLFFDGDGNPTREIQGIVDTITFRGILTGRG